MNKQPQTTYNCSSREPGFSFQHPHGGSQPFITPVAKDKVTFWLLGVPGKISVHIKYINLNFFSKENVFIILENLKVMDFFSDSEYYNFQWALSDVFC